MQHRLDLVDVNYVYMPRKSSAFQEYLDSMSLRNSALKASYENQLVVRTGTALPITVQETHDAYTY